MNKAVTQVTLLSWINVRDIHNFKIWTKNMKDFCPVCGSELVIYVVGLRRGILC